MIILGDTMVLVTRLRFSCIWKGTESRWPWENTLLQFNCVHRHISLFCYDLSQYFFTICLFISLYIVNDYIVPLPQYRIHSCSYCSGETRESKGCWRCFTKSCSDGPDSWKGNVLVFLFSFVQLLCSLDILSKGQFDQEESLCQCLILQVSEERLISLLEQINNQTTKQTKVTVSPCYLSITKLVLRAFFIWIFWTYLFIYFDFCFFRFRGVEVFLKMMIKH